MSSTSIQRPSQASDHLSTNLKKNENEGSTNLLSPDAYYHLIRGQLDSETSILSQKISWLVGSQAFLYIAYTTLLNAPETPRFEFLYAQHKLFLWLTPFTGFSTALLTYVGILSSIAYLSELRRVFEKYPTNQLVLTFPPIHGNSKLRRMTELSIKLLPLTFLLTWGTTFLKQFISNG